MCQICHQYICPSACPNAETRVIGKCTVCGQRIYDYEPAITVDGQIYHTECLEDLPLPALLDELGHTYEMGDCGG